MSLRLRLLLAVGAVALTALAIADVVTYQELRSFLYNRIDQSLEQSHMPIEGALGSGPRPRGLFPSAGGNAPTGRSGPGPTPSTTPPSPAATPPASTSPPSCAGFSGLSGNLLHELQPGTFIEVRSSSNAVLCKSTLAEFGSDDTAGPKLPGHITGFVADAANDNEKTAYFTARASIATTGGTGCGHRYSTGAPTTAGSSWWESRWARRSRPWTDWSAWSWR